MDIERRALLAHFAAALGSVAGATVIATWLDAHVSLAVLALVYLTAVLVVSYWASFAASAVTAVMAVLALNFFFVPPRGALTVHATENLLTLAALLGVALLVSRLSSRLRATAERARNREQRARSLQLLAGELAAADDEGRILEAAQRSLCESVGAPVTIALRGPDGLLKQAAADASAPPLSTLEHDALNHCAQEGRALGPGTGRWNELSHWYLPLCAGGQSMGALALPAQGRADDAREHAQAIADLLAGALRRARHAAEAVEARSEAKSQQLRNALLASVSHDFRTPLASIIGAVSSLQGQHDRLGEQDRLGLLALIDGEAHHLAAMTENTLQWVRLSSPEPALRHDWESMEEIVGSVLTRVRRRDPVRRVKAEVPAQLPLVRADAVLLTQLLENLLDNALKYSDGPVQLRVQSQDDMLHVDVLDRGPGVDEGELPRLFDTFYRGSHARSVRGAGLGLGVGRAIAEVHGGTLSARPRQGGGSRFRLSLPLQRAPVAPSEGH